MSSIKAGKTPQKAWPSKSEDSESIKKARVCWLWERWLQHLCLNKSYDYRDVIVNHCTSCECTPIHKYDAFSTDGPSGDSTHPINLWAVWECASKLSVTTLTTYRPPIEKSLFTASQLTFKRHKPNSSDSFSAGSRRRGKRKFREN